MITKTSKSIKKADQDLKNIRFYSLGSPTEKQSTLAGLPSRRCMKKAPFTVIHEKNDHKNHVGCLSKSIKKADQDLKNIRFYSLGSPTEKQSTLAGLPSRRCMKKAPFTVIHEKNDHKNHVGCLSKSIKKADQDLKNIRFYSLGSPTEKQSTLAGLPSRRCMKKALFTVIHEKNDHKNHVGCLSKSIKKADQDLENIRFYSLGSPTETHSTLAGLPSRRCMKKAPFTVIHEKNDHKNHVGCLSKSIKKADQDLKNIRFYSLGSPTEKQSTLAGLPSRRCMKKAPFTVIHEKSDHKNHVGCLSKSIKKADQDLENIRFYSLGSPTEKQSTLAGLPSRRCMKKAPFTVIHEKNDHKNHVGCLSKSIKKADQDLENIRFYSLGSPTEKQSTLAGLPSSRCMKKAPFTVIHEKNDHKNHDVSRSPSKKQIRTSKTSGFIVLARQLKNSQHWQGYHRAGA